MGVEREIIIEGDGINYPKVGDDVTIHYTGTLENKNGKKFDSSVDRCKPFITKIGVGQVIRGWDEAVPKMSLGEKSVLTITSDFGYGERGFTQLIPPHATLCFEVELLAIGTKKAPGFKG